MQYAKLVNNELSILRLPITLAADLITGDVTHPAGSDLSTDDAAVLLALGYKPVAYTQAPDQDGYYAVPSWTESATEITQTWTLEALPPLEPTAEERIEALEAAMLDMVLGGDA